MTDHQQTRERQRHLLHRTLKACGHSPSDTPAGMVGRTRDGRLIVRGVTKKGQPIDVGVPEVVVPFTPLGLQRAVDIGQDFADGLQLQPSGGTPPGGR